MWGQTRKAPPFAERGLRVTAGAWGSDSERGPCGAHSIYSYFSPSSSQKAHSAPLASVFTHLRKIKNK